MQTLTVGAPGPWATTNQRHHWTVRNRLTQAWRSAAAWQARGQTFVGISTITKWCTCDGYEPIEEKS